MTAATVTLTFQLVGVSNRQERRKIDSRPCEQNGDGGARRGAGPEQCQRERYLEECREGDGNRDERRQRNGQTRRKRRTRDRERDNVRNRHGGHDPDNNQRKRSGGHVETGS